MSGVGSGAPAAGGGAEVGEWLASSVPASADPRLAAAMAAIDAANADDPTSLEVEGQVRPKELAHAVLMTEWVQRLDPEATDLQLLAARAHHLRRWSIAREEYPEGRAGYLRWRTALRRQHAEEVGELLAGVGYGPEEIERVQQIIRKEGLGRDPQVQTHEDALCLVFVQTQFTEVAERLGDDKIVDVVRKTLAKMSKQGIAAALDLPLGERQRALIERAAAIEA